MLRTGGVDRTTTCVPVAARSPSRSATSARRKSSISGDPGAAHGVEGDSRRSARSRVPAMTTTTSGRVAATWSIHPWRAAAQRSTSRSTAPSARRTHPPTARPHSAFATTVPSIGDRPPTARCPSSEAANWSPITVTVSGRGGAVVGVAAAACCRLVGAGRSIVTRPVVTSSTSTAAGATTRARRAGRSPPTRTGCSRKRNIRTDAVSVTAMRSANSGPSDHPTRSGVSHRKIGQCSRYTP